MPTTRPRHVVTESDELAEALDAQAGFWPGLSRAQLLARLAIEGARLSGRDRAGESDRRRALLARAGQEFAGTEGRADLEAMRAQDWPA